MISIRDKLLEAIRRCDASAVAKVLDSSNVNLDEPADGNLLLIEAIDSGDHAILDLLLKHGANVNNRDSRGTTPLIHAASLVVPAVVRRLLAHGAEPNLSDKNRVPLDEVAMRTSPGTMEIAELLLLAGANPNFIAQTPRGDPTSTVLMSAAFAANVGVAKKLLDAGARINDVLALGTALTRAVEGGDATMVQTLLDAGADASLQVPPTSFSKSIAGKSALEIARAKKRCKLVAILETHATLPLRAAGLNTGKIEENWKRIIKNLPPQTIATFRPPVSKTEIGLLQKAIGAELPPPLVELLSILDGQVESSLAGFIRSEDPLDGEFRLLSCEEIINEWGVCKSLLGRGEFQKPIGDQPRDGVRDEWFNPGWIPITSNGAGDHHCVDLTPDSDGKIGQVILVYHDSASRPCLAENLGEWLSQIVDP